MKTFYCTFVLLFLFFHGRTQRVKIPIDSTRWYQLNNTASNLNKLFDGDLSTVPFPGWGLMLSSWEAYYPLLNGERMAVDSIRMYDRENIFTNTPLFVYAITANSERKLLATFTGEKYLAWVGPYPSRSTFVLDTAVGNIRGLVLQVTGYGFPAELELYGTYTPPSVVSSIANPPHEPLKKMFGINGFAWNWVDQSGSNIYISEPKTNAMKSFGGFRQYLDWQKSEPVEGRYYFSPQDGGGWPLDTVYKKAQEMDVDMVATFQNLPAWMVATYPDSLKAIDNNPVRYGNAFSDPASYVEQARLGFQFAARYGRNKNVDSNLVSVYSIPAWYNQKVNSKKIGLGLVKYMECGNEVDKTWRGRKGYLSGREYAANLSAFYDGHKNTLGPAVGVKNADSTMQVVMSGIAFPSTDYLRGIIDWCKDFRGYKADGRVDLCFDVINYHYYSSDRKFYQSTNGTRGTAPEKSVADSVARNFIEAAHAYAYDVPVWITEQGYDINQESPLKAIAVGTRTAAETQADWILRSGLLYARRGFGKSFFYQLFDFDVNYGGKFSSMGLIDKNTFVRKPAADFLYQTIRQFGEYRFVETLNGDPFVDKYEYNGQTMYALAVPDEAGRTATYELNLAGADSAIVYMPTVGSDSMTQEKRATTNGVLPLTVTETPVFVVPTYAHLITVLPNPAAAKTTRVQNVRPANAVAGGPADSSGAETSSAKETVTVFPNPANDRVFIQNRKPGKWKIVLFNMQGKKIDEAFVSGGEAVVHLQRLPSGIYPLYVLGEDQSLLYSRFVIKR